jgi:pimeloyl-ACP methyl ester carboxylesterase
MEADPRGPIRETPVFFPAGDETLFGILTLPSASPRAAAVVVAPAGGSFTWVHRDRFPVRACRLLAQEGFHTFRFDYRSVGESTGTVPHFRLADSFPEDLAGAVRWIQEQGIGRQVLIGYCFGARSILACLRGPNGLDGLDRVVLLDPPVHDETSAILAARFRFRDYVRRALRPRVVRRLFDAERRRVYQELMRAKLRTTSHRRESTAGDAWVSAVFLEGLQELVRRGVPTLCVYGVDDEEYGDFRRASSGRLGAILDRAGPLIEVVTTPGRVHAFDALPVQDEVTEILARWISRQPIGLAESSG